MSLYTFTGTAFTRTAVVNAGPLPQRIGAADLDGNGLDDLVIANTLDATVTIAFQQAAYKLDRKEGKKKCSRYRTRCTRRSSRKLPCNESRKGKA